MRRNVLLPVTAAMALLFTACGSDDPSADTVDTVADGGLRSPTPIEAAGAGSADDGTGRATAATEEMSADMMIAPAYIVTDYVVGPDLPPLPDNTTGYVFDAATAPSADQAAELAGAFGVSGEPQRVDDGFADSWRVGPVDGSAPSVVIWDDAMLAWNYDAGWDDRELVVCASAGAEPAIAPDGEPVSPDESVVVEPAPDECVVPEPPENVPSAGEAEALTADHLNALGVDPASVTFDTWADEWSASVTANAMFDGVVARSWGFTYGEDGELRYAWGNAATPEPVGPYDLVDLDTAVDRLRSGDYGFGFGGRGDIAVMAATEDATTDDAATDDPLPPPTDAATSSDVAPAVQEPFDEDMPVDVPEGDVEPAPGEPKTEPIPVEPDGGIGDGAEPLPEPMPVEPVPEPEEITVTLVDVEPDLWWVWDVHGSAWLVPAYRFIGDDGGWYTVPAVTDDFLVQTPVDPEPLPEPAPGTTEPAEPVDPVDPVDPDSIERYFGLPVDEFTAEVEADGLGPVRVVWIDGEDLEVTADFVVGRVNARVETREGVQYVVDATIEGEGELPDVPATTVAPTTVPVTTVADPGDPQAEVVPIVGTFEAVEFYPACGNEILEHEGVTWYTLASYEFPSAEPQYAERVEELISVEREPSPVVGANGFAARVAEPGPGDDVGTLVVWADGVARFVSDSGDLDVWLVDDELEYSWVC